MELTIEQINQKLDNKESFEFLVTKKDCITCEAMKNTLDARDVSIDTYEWQPTDKLPIKMAAAVEGFPTYVNVVNGDRFNFKLNPGADFISDRCA